MSHNQIEHAGLYIHVPFCIRKCPYCDFYSITDLSLRDDFIRGLIKEMDMLSFVDLTFDTIYIGGGTPSILDVFSIDRILEHAHRHFKMLSSAEITVEVNPGTIDLERLRGYQRAGMNRINIGVQSFRENNLRFLGRIHSAKEAGFAVSQSRKAGFLQIGLDLIYGIPGQTLKNWISDLKQAVGFEPDHLSCYMLTYEPGTPMERHLQNKRFRPLDEKQVADMFETTIAYLENAGYVQYEISNFARSFRNDSEPRQSRHNRKYWSMAPYIGLGPSAHSFMEPVRWWNLPSTRTYIDNLIEGRSPDQEKEVLNPTQMMIEAIYLGLRKTEGIHMARFEKKFGFRFMELFGKTVSDLSHRGMLLSDGYRCALSRKGMLLLDSIAAMFVCQDCF